MNSVLQAAARLVGLSEEQPSPPIVQKPEMVRRILLIVRLIDADYVLQRTEPTVHQPRKRYATEGKSLLRSIFSSPEPQFSAREKANDKFAEIFDFRRPNDLVLKPHFERKDEKGQTVEWHPVLFHLEVYMFDRSLFDNADLSGWTVCTLEEHEFAKKLRQQCGDRDYITVDHEITLP